MGSVWPQVDPRAAPGQSEALHPLLHPWVRVRLAFPTLEFAPRTQPEISMCSCDRPDSIHDRIQLWLLFKLLRFWQAVQRSACLWLPKASLICKYPGLLSLLSNSLWRDLPLSSASPCPLHMGTGFWTNRNTGRGIRSLQEEMVWKISYGDQRQKPFRN